MGVVISGMHRSGTSMIAEWISLTGLGMGEGPRYEADTANPKGLFERKDIVAFNDRWLGVLGGAWWAPPNVQEQTWRSIEPLKLSAARPEIDLLRARFGGWFVKDPRLSLLMPLWDRLALTTLPTVVSLRQPRDVAMSLHMRNGMTLRRALALWLAYYQAIFSNTKGREFLVLDVTRSLERPEHAAETLLDFLESLNLKGASDPFTIASSTDPSLLRQQCQRLPGSAERLAGDLDEAYEHMRALHAITTHDENFDLRMPDWAIEALDESREVWDLQVQKEIVQGHLDRVQGQLDRAEARLLELHNVPTVRLWRMIRGGK